MRVEARLIDAGGYRVPIDVDATDFRRARVTCHVLVHVHDLGRNHAGPLADTAGMLDDEKLDV
ncbi:MAG: hypothetical protein SFX73_26595 [Kofleriaceae bacterium]|nr:hypothetical protein [Kofleriaceae bacterium]